MVRVRKIIGVAALLAVVLAAGSVVCLASGKPMAPGCDNGTSGAAACPFMTVSVPAVAAPIAGREVAAFFMVVLAVVFSFGAAFSREHAGTVSVERMHMAGERFSAPLLNPVLQSISSGILHSRIYEF
ncbi:MAG: hypothetical protein KGJ13_03915 [Patescibacteria group bacterium]|nr:hypothetical protein [Patescibacteria group bacterium]